MKNKRSARPKKISFFRVLEIVFLFWILFGMLWLFMGAWEAVQHDKAKSLAYEAKAVYSLSQDWLEENAPRTLTDTSGQICAGGEEESFAAYLAQKMENQNWYAIVCDEDGIVQYVLCSRCQIRDLSPVSWEETLKSAENPFTAHETVAMYVPQDKK